MYRSNLTTKGKVLEDLSKSIKTAKILPLLRFKRYIYEYDKDNVVNNIQRNFKENLLIIRSAANNEDNEDSSNAGHYKSILNIPRLDKIKLIEAIDNVISSYDSKDSNNEIFVQPMLSNIKLSGVVFTADIDTLSP
ncbi:MAG: PEP/pyruvate-binding domain-containing protein, partial [Candidatus Methanoperedens sp.]